MATAMVDSARSLSSVGGGCLPYEMGMVNTETRLGDDVLSRTFVKELEHYYDKASTGDKAKCLELITSVRLGEELKNHIKEPTRPKSAMPAFGYTSMDVLSPYKSTYTREYPPKAEDEVKAFRPMTSQGYATQLPQSQPPGPTTYDVEFARKFQRPASPERIGTASGNRNNRPHPAQSFMVWKLPRKNRHYVGPDSPLDEDLTNQKLNQITKRLCHSVYQNDYLGIPQGFQVRSAFNLPPDWRGNVPYGMESNQRETYQQPFQQPELLLPTNRYGSNFKKPIPSVAIIPTANKRLIGVNGRTTYDRHYNDNAGPVAEQIRDVGRKLGAEALKKHYMRSSGMDKELIGKLMEEYGSPPSPMMNYQVAPTPAPPSYNRPLCPSPPSRSGSASHHTPAPTVRSCQKSPCVGNGRSHSVTAPTPPPVGSNRPASRSSSPAYKPRPAVPAATAIMLPSQSPNHVQMPTSPPSMPYTPPLFLS